MLQTTFTTEFSYGPIPIGFPLHLEGKYIALLGINGSGKTSLLNVLFQKNQRENVEGKTQVCLINTTTNMHTLVQPSGRTLEQYNVELAKAIEERNKKSHKPNSDELLVLLLNHNNFMKQVQKLNYYLEYLDLSEYKLQETPDLFSGQRRNSFPGSAQYILPILAALTDDYIKMVLIDEPYALISPHLRERLRDLFFEVSKEKQIIVTTHSNAFTNVKEYMSNYFITSENNDFRVARASSEDQLESISSAEIKLIKVLARAVPSITSNLPTSFDIEKLYSKKPEDINPTTKNIQENHEEINITIFYEELKKSIMHNKDELATRHKERVQQTNIAYYVSLICLIFSVLLVFIGVILIFISKLEGGVLTTVASIISSVVSSLAFVFNKQVNDQEREDSMQMRTLEKSYDAMGYISCMTDERKRNELIERLVEKHFFEN